LLSNVAVKFNVRRHTKRRLRSPACLRRRFRRDSTEAL
jgi:hypothetical protein